MNKYHAQKVTIDGKTFDSRKEANRWCELRLLERATLGSLFDGIGGFPLVWETRHGKGTALWVSEIEPFPIAVTKERFQ